MNCNMILDQSVILLIRRVSPVMSDIFPKTPSDERDPQEDQREDSKREDEISEGKPPHYED